MKSKKFKSNNISDYDGQFFIFPLGLANELLKSMQLYFMFCLTTDSCVVQTTWVWRVRVWRRARRRLTTRTTRRSTTPLTTCTTNTTSTSPTLPTSSAGSSKGNVPRCTVYISWRREWKKFLERWKRNTQKTN